MDLAMDRAIYAINDCRDRLRSGSSEYSFGHNSYNSDNGKSRAA